MYLRIQNKIISLTIFRIKCIAFTIRLIIIVECIYNFFINNIIQNSCRYVYMVQYESKIVIFFINLFVLMIVNIIMI